MKVRKKLPEILSLNLVLAPENHSQGISSRSSQSMMYAFVLLVFHPFLDIVALGALIFVGVASLGAQLSRRFSSRHPIPLKVKSNCETRHPAPKLVNADVIAISKVVFFLAGSRNLSAFPS